MTTWNLEVPADLTIDIKQAVGRVELVTGPAGHATVELSADGRAGEELIQGSRVELVGDRLIVHVPEGSGRGLGLFRLRIAASVRTRLTVPEGAALDADLAAADIEAPLTLRAAEVRTASGDVRIGDVTGPASVHTASGDVRVGHVEGELSVATASGDVRTGDVERTASVRTASGDLSLGCLDRDARLRSVSGDIDVRKLCGGDVDIASTSGDLRLRVAPGLQIHLDVASVSGQLHSDLGAGDESASSTVDLSLRARSISGDVTITRSRSNDTAQVV